jgi:hypothetical protein
MAKNRPRSAHRRQRLGRVLRCAVDVVARAELAGKLLLVAAAIDRDGAEALARRELNPEMSEAAHPVNGDDVARGRPRYDGAR